MRPRRTTRRSHARTNSDGPRAPYLARDPPLFSSDFATFTQQFGASSQGWEQVSIYSSVFNGSDATFRPEFTLAFDELGSPFVYDYTKDQTNDLNDGSVVIHVGQFSTTVAVSPATGEITVN